MTTILQFPLERTRRHRELQRDQELQNDSYYLFVKNIMSVVYDCGFKLPNSVEACAQAWYDKNKHLSQISRKLSPVTPKQD